MKTNQPSVLHIDTGKEWRGGQQQAANLFSLMHTKGYPTFLACQPRSSFEKWCTEKTLPFFSVYMRGEWDIIAGIKISLFCKKHGIVIIHAHDAHAVTIAIWAKIFNTKLRIVASRRVDFPIKRTFFKRLKYSQKRISIIICISNAIKKKLLHNGFPEEQLITIHDGINLNRFANSPEPATLSYIKENLQKKSIVVGTIAAFVKNKDYPTLIEAAQRVNKLNSNVIFLALGTGPDLQKIKNMVHSLNLDKIFLFPGFQNNVGSFLKRFDIFVLTSKNEGLGSSILDAQSLGKPVIATSAGGIPEVVHDNKNGILIPIQSPKRLAEAIICLVNDPEKRKEFGDAGKNTVEHFSFENMVANNIKLYNTL